MKLSKAVVSALFPLLVIAPLPQQWREERTARALDSTNSSINNERTTPEKNDTIIIEHCYAQELSAGAALNIVVVLATASVLQIPGTLIWPRSTLYRLAPELGLVELIPVLLAIGNAIFIRRGSIKAAVTSVLVQRYQQQFIDPDERQAGIPIFESTEEYEANPFVNRLQRFGLGRILGDSLVVLAFIKSTAVKGTVRTNVLAASYALSFFTLEILSLAALRLDPRPRTRAQAEAELAEINSLALTQNVNRRSLLDLDQPSWKYGILAGTALAIFGLTAAMNVFWPFGLPSFLLFDFQEMHSVSGKWVFTYSTCLRWVFWLSVVGAGTALVLSLPPLVLGKFPERREKYLEVVKRLPVFLLLWNAPSAYAVLKFAIIVKFYVADYTGIGTVKPNWLDWLG
jgi:hypothetical protein